VVATKSHPKRILDEAAIRAVRKWKYNPKVENGEAMERPGIEVRLEFALKG
jgi:protein TonB